MGFQTIIAVIHIDSLEAVEEALKNVGAVEVAVTRIKGYGDYKNFYDPEWVSEQARVEVFVSHELANSVVNAICHAAYSGLDSDGMVAVLPVESLLRIKDSMPRPTL